MKTLDGITLAAASVVYCPHNCPGIVPDGIRRKRPSGSLEALFGDNKSTGRKKPLDDGPVKMACHMVPGATNAAVAQSCRMAQIRGACSKLKQRARIDASSEEGHDGTAVQVIDDFQCRRREERTILTVPTELIQQPSVESPHWSAFHSLSSIDRGEQAGLIPAG